MWKQEMMTKLLLVCSNKLALCVCLGTELTGDEATNEALRAQLAKTEISMTLSARVEVHTDEKADLKSLLIRSAYGFKSKICISVAMLE
jgi:hypothetical protein